MATLSNIRKHQRLLSSVSLFAFAAMWAGTSLANPTGGTVAAGQATISAPDPSTLVINQTSGRAIINWDNFDINAGETTRFQQPDTQSVTLNRDFSGDPSRIMGNLEANGRVFLINRSGMLFGQNSRVDTAGLVASTHDITDDNFLDGNYVFDQQGDAGASIVNLGNISIADQGLAAFVGPSVRNDGVIVARLGTVELASANGFTLDFNGDEQLTLFVENPIDQVGYTIDGERIENLVKNQGRIEADGGLVVLSAVAARGVVNDVINHDGVIQANSVGVRNGKIILSGGSEGVVRVSGTVSATGGDTGEVGGHIEITGKKVGLFDGANVDASGHSGGGTALVGGDYQGRGDTPTAEFTYVAANARVSADAQETGDGGRAIIWADDTTRAYGTVTATGGAQSGDGGFIEVSGRASLDIAGLEVHASAAAGTAGEVLFDPGNIYIVRSQAEADNHGNVDLSNPFVAGGDTYIWNYAVSEYLSAGNDVTLQGLETGDGSDGNIYINANIEKFYLDSRSNTETTLSLFAADEVIFGENVDVLSDAGMLNLYIDADYDRHSYGLISLPASSGIYTNGGFTNFNGSDFRILGTVDTTDGRGGRGLQREAHDYFEHTDFAFLREADTEIAVDDQLIVEEATPEAGEAGQTLEEKDTEQASDDQRALVEVVDEASFSGAISETTLRNLEEVLAEKFGSTGAIRGTVTATVTIEYIESFIKLFWRGGYLNAHLDKAKFYQKVLKHLSSKKDMANYLNRKSAGKFNSFAAGFAAGIALDIATGIAEDMLNEIGGGNAMFEVAGVKVPADAVVQPLRTVLIWNTPVLGGPLGASIDQTVYTVDKLVEVVEAHGELQDAWAVSEASMANLLNSLAGTKQKAALAVEANQKESATRLEAVFNRGRVSAIQLLEDDYGLDGIGGVVDKLILAQTVLATSGSDAMASRLVDEAIDKAEELEGFFDNFDVLDNNDYDKVTRSLIESMGLASYASQGKLNRMR